MPDNTGVEETTAADDFGLGVETGEISPVAIVDMVPTFDGAVTSEDVAAEAEAWLATQQPVVAPEVYTAMEETLNPLTDAVNSGIVPPAQARYFYFWLGVKLAGALIPAVGIYAFIQKYVVEWAQSNGWATMGPDPVQTPLAQAFIESANAASPVPGAVNIPAVLPSPSVGQSTVGAAAKEIAPQTTTAPGLSPSAAAAVQAAIGVAAADLLKAQAAVVDSMLPNMAPGQVPEALGQLNTAVNALEAQMSQVRNGQWPRGFVGLQQAVGGALQALHGAEQAIAHLTDQMATKADSTLEDDINANSTAIQTLAGTVGTVVGTTLPNLTQGLAETNSALDGVKSELDNTVVPELNATTAATNANTVELSGTDKECLDQLCDALNNVTNPIKEGGATPSLLKTLGALLGAGLALTTIIGMMDTLLAVLNVKTAVQGVVSDTETLTAWAEQAAGVIETQFSLAGWG